MSAPQVPVFQQYMNPILAALRALGGSASIDVLDTRVSRDMQLSPEVLAVPHKPEQPDRSEVAYRMAWARTYLKYAGLLTNPSRGIWALTEQGTLTSHIDEYALASHYATRVKADPGEAAEVDAEHEASSHLDPRIKTELRSLFETLLARGAVLRREQAFAAYRLFRERFGPDVLAGLDGERLLSTIHGRQTKDSLVYWLEFKDDDELPARFGSIAGGSALKFGIYQSKEGDWWTGTPQKQIPLSIEEAIDRTRQHRDQLLRGLSTLNAFAASGSDDYGALQASMVQAAPDLADTAWGHKYFALLHPEELDDYHALAYQNYHLVKLLQLPPGRRYSNARPLVRIAQELSILPSQLCTVLNHRDGSPHEYWRVGTTTARATGSEWPRMRDGGFMAIGWSDLGDLSDVPGTKEGKDQLRDRMEKQFPGPGNVITRKTQEVFNFAVNVNERDVVLAMDGGTVKGIGVVRGPYYFQEGDGPFGHRRRVEWRDISEWSLPEAEGLRTTFVPLGKRPQNLVAVETRLLSSNSKPIAPKVQPTPAPVTALTGIPSRVQAALDRKLQVILYGPPGTGKTHWADNTIWELVARAWFGKVASELSQQEREAARQQRAISFCTFHPAYGYEDFIEGYRPTAGEAGLGFQLEPGLFKEVCDRARHDTSRPYFLLIDEINRGDIPRIFGELLTLLEKDKRGLELRLPLSRERFSVPTNIRLVATMNTADRSIALLDAALRRRFAFVELMPDISALGTANLAGLPLGPWLKELNERIVRHVGRDARNLQIGHAYLMHGSRPISDPARFMEIFRDDLMPLLEEYCYEDFEALASILGSALIQRERQGATPRFLEFADAKDLIAALLQSFEGLATAPEAIAAEETSGTSHEADDDDSLDESTEDTTAA